MDVLTKASGPGMLDQLRGPEALPQLIILDIMMPGMNGIECLRRLRAEPAWAGVPVIIYSADFHFERMKQALQLGAAEYVVKGTTRWDDFLALIHRHARITPKSP